MTNRISRIGGLESILDPQINAVVVTDFERPYAKSGGPLDDWIVTVKESFDVEGLPTTLGMRANLGNVAAEDSEVVRRLRAAGARIVGKTNVSAMLAGFSTENELYGRTNHPLDASRGVGGSSGGSAAAVAAGFARLDVGSDLGGSLRNPAHYCGVFAHKPTFGLVSMRGHGLPSMPRDPDMAVAGPLARTAEDLALAMNVLAERPLPPPPARSLRVALWPDDDFSPVHPEIAERIADAGLALASRGIAVKEARPAFEPSVARATFSSLVRAMWAGQPPPGSACDERERIRDVWRELFEDVDAILCPVVTTCARPHDDPPPLSDIFWASLATLAYLPATVFPAGRSSTGLPIGIQVIGPESGDLTTIAVAGLF